MHCRNKHWYEMMVLCVDLWMDWMTVIGGDGHVGGARQQHSTYVCIPPHSTTTTNHFPSTGCG